MGLISRILKSQQESTAKYQRITNYQPSAEERKNSRRMEVRSDIQSAAQEAFDAYFIEDTEDGFNEGDSN